jgi:hypothetical protein
MHMDLERRNVAHLINVLADHRGRDRGIGVQGLAGKLKTSQRAVRHLVSEAREMGVAICAMPEVGYFVADNADEIEACCKFLRSRAMHSLHLESRLRQIPLPDLLGQLHLNT